MAPYRKLFNLWLSYVAAMVVLGWALSAASSYDMMGYASVIVILVLAYMEKRSWRNVSSEEKSNLKNDLIFWPFLLLLVLISLAGSLYTTAVLDSLSYRIPRMLMWLQEGGIHYIDNPDDRLNFMTPLWEFASTPLYQLAGFRLLWLGSAISWILLYLVFVWMSKNLGIDPKNSKWLAIIPAASVGFVLQAASTMNDIWTAAFIAISLAFILMFEEKRESRDILSSGLALALAAGAKPHFAVLALPWILWCIFSKSKPLSCINWNKALLVGLLALLCSPLPTFITNHIHYGSIKGPAGEGGFALGPWWINILLGSVMMIWQMFLPSILPMAKMLDASIHNVINDIGFTKIAPRFSLNAKELALVDNASLGFACSIILVIGLLISIHRKTFKNNNRWTYYAALSGITGFLISISQVVPTTCGRSFIGFTVLCIPICILGLAKIKRKWIYLAAIISLFTASFALIFSPSHPLWPAQTIANYLPSLKSKFTPYLTIQERAINSRIILDSIPKMVKEIGLLATGDQPLIYLWGDFNRKVHVIFLPAKTTTNQLFNNGPEYIVCLGEPDAYSDRRSDLAKSLASDENFSLVSKGRIVSRLKRGSEYWELYRRGTPPAKKQ